MKATSQAKLSAALLSEHGYKISTSGVQKAEKAGRIKRERHGWFDVAKCLKALQRNSNPDARRRGSKRSAGRSTKKTATEETASTANVASGGAGELAAPASTESLADASRRKEIALANLNEVKLAVQRGELVDLAEINAFVAGMIIRAREILMRMPGEMRDRLARETDAVKVGEMLDKEIRRALGQLAEYKVC